MDMYSVIYRTWYAIHV